MVDVALIPAIKAALKYNELGDASPYALSFACLGQSGASFGIFQADLHTNGPAMNTLEQCLDAAGLDVVEGNRLMVALSGALPNGNPLSDADLATVNAALSSPAGMALVDALDGETLQIVLHELDECIAAAGDDGIAPDAQIAIALWVNMTGEPTSLLTWLASASIPSRPLIALADVMTYLAGTLYFRVHTRDLVHFKDAVAAGVRWCRGRRVASARSGEQPGRHRRLFCVRLSV
jgi:hypothetical protein